MVAVILVGLSGWYFLLRGRTQNVNQADAGRGIGQNTPEASVNGSTFDNTSGGGGGGGSADAGQGNALPPEPGVTYTGSQPAGNTRGVNLPLGMDMNGSISSASGTPGSKFKTPRLWHLAKLPVAGFGFVTSATSTPKIYYVERSTGYLFYVDAGTGGITRISNTLLPKTYEALISLDGSAILRGLDAAGNVTTFAASSSRPSGNGTPQSLKGGLLDRDISAITAQQGSRSIFFIQDLSDKSVGYTALWDGTKKKQVFSSALGEWRVFYLADGELDVAQKPDDGIPGYAYRIETNGRLTPRARNIPGLTILPKTNSPALLYGSSDGLTVTMFARPSENVPPISLSIKTAADKCVWSSKALFAYCAVPGSITEKNYLHNRYLGVTHSEDTWWKVDAATGTTQLFFSDRAPGEMGVDVQDPVMDPTGNYILFRNAADQSLWLLRIPL